ncbi:MAG: ABC transporter permease [Candidatus Babeliaceae bacterium]|jgi:spermidine/putrescine transport system permease protein
MADKTSKAGFLSTFFVVLVYLFLYIPTVVLVVFSFNKMPFPAPWTEFTLQWYYDLYHASHLWEAFYTSLIVAFLSTFLSIIMGISLMFYAVQGGRVKKLLILFYGNLMIPEIVLAIGLLTLFSLCSIPLGLGTLVIAHTVLGLGYVIPLVYTRFVELDYRLIEASLDLGASYSQTFFKIILPLLRPSLIAAGLLVFIISFDDFVLSYFCSGSSVQTLSLYILSMARSGISPIINALSTILLMLSSLLVLIFCSINARSRIF